MTEYQPRTAERLIEILRAQGANPRSWQAEAAGEIERLNKRHESDRFDIRETYRAVLHYFGPEGVSKVIRHLDLARRSRDTNAEIDELEKLFGEEAALSHRQGQDQS